MKNIDGITYQEVPECAKRYPNDWHVEPKLGSFFFPFFQGSTYDVADWQRTEFRAAPGSPSLLCPVLLLDSMEVTSQCP
jgi:hypothetical protein